MMTRTLGCLALAGALFATGVASADVAPKQAPEKKGGCSMQTGTSGSAATALLVLGAVGLLASRRRG